MGFELSPGAWDQERNKAILSLLGLTESGSASSLAICLCLSFLFLSPALSQFPSPICVSCLFPLSSLWQQLLAYKMFPVIPLITVDGFLTLNLNRSPIPTSEVSAASASLPPLRHEDRAQVLLCRPGPQTVTDIESASPFSQMGLGRRAPSPVLWTQSLPCTLKIYRL